MISKKYSWLKKPIFWGLLLAFFDVFYAFYYFIIPFFYYSFSTKNFMINFWNFLNYPILYFTEPLFTSIVQPGPHTSPFVFLFYNLLIAALLFFFVYFSFYLFRTAKKRNWFDKPVFFGLLFSVPEFIYTLIFIGTSIVDYNNPAWREFVDFMVSTGQRQPFYYYVLDYLLSSVLLFIIGYIVGYIIKMIRKKFLYSR